MEAFVQSFDQFLTVIEIWVEKKGTRTDHTCLKEKGIGMKRKQPMREKKKHNWVCFTTVNTAQQQACSAERKKRPCKTREVVTAVQPDDLSGTKPSAMLQLVLGLAHHVCWVRTGSKVGPDYNFVGPPLCFLSEDDICPFRHDLGPTLFILLL